MTKARAKKRKKTNGQQVAFFITRKSYVDETLWFSDEGHRVYFSRASWAAWLMPQFDKDQEARIVRGPVKPDDRPYQVYLRAMLPGDVTVKEYLAMVEHVTKERVRGNDLSRRKIRMFLRRVEAQHGASAVYS